MSKKRTIKGLVAASLVTFGMVTAAHATVSCPTTSDVKGAVKALNTVMRQSERGFFVLTAQPAINSSNLGWMVATQEKANGFDAAFNGGQNSVNSVIAAVTDKPIEQQGVYLCAYMTTSGMNVMALAPQQQGMTFKPSMFNLDAVK